MFGFGSAMRNLTEAAHKGELMACSYRNDECVSIAQSLSYMYRKSVLVVGGPGSGRTTLLHGVAAASLNGGNLDGGRAHRLLELNPAVLKSRTVRIKEVTTELIAALRENPSEVLVIDGMMPVLMAKPDPDDPAYLLGNTIRKTDICCIGTLLPREFEEIVRADARTEHIFKVLRLRPFSCEEAIGLLMAMRPKLERESKLRISDKAIRKSVTLSQEYLPDIELPGKAVMTLRRAMERCGQRLRSPGDMAYPEIDTSLNPLSDEVGSYDVKKALAAWTSVDVLAAEARKWETKLAERLKRRIFGQDMAVEQMVTVLARLRSRFAQPGCPAGVAVFGGPPGVGKAHTARSIAQAMMGPSRGLVELSLRDHTGTDALTRLFNVIASPRGSVDAGDKSSSLQFVLLRDMAEADPLVLGPLLRMTTKDCLRQQRCRCDPSRRCFFIFLLNCDSSSVGGDRDSWLSEMLASRIRKDLVQNIDAIVPFAPLDYAAQNAVMRTAIAGLHAKAGGRHVRIGMNDEAFRVVARDGYTKEEGARSLLRTLSRKVLEPVTEILDSGQLPKGGAIDVMGNAGKISFRTKAFRNATIDDME